ncbi:hypothetical protein F3Y22_tig00111996pilonHSYRG00283 [Hibiscus syriacus]|uniref:Uncharacterized protein n=1 Tax=Hibiscus syriacus TaxID=106335 RepID=A0A6A2X706_HIBSY|nr:hypothetical protein F3Y22_tig00111996pilonHSYRG00283 [Hibiscus syriacus]
MESGHRRTVAGVKNLKRSWEERDKIKVWSSAEFKWALNFGVILGIERSRATKTWWPRDGAVVDFLFWFGQCASVGKKKGEIEKMRGTAGLALITERSGDEEASFVIIIFESPSRISLLKPKSLASWRACIAVIASAANDEAIFEVSLLLAPKTNPS